MPVLLEEDKNQYVSFSQKFKNKQQIKPNQKETKSKEQKRIKQKTSPQ